MRHVIVGTAGHIDHGKSALVRMITGTDPDRLKEEKLRGITIDLGFAHLDLGDIQIGFVDVPGHEKFVKNMLAGVGGIDLVLLVVAADASIMPQTREHFDICRLLGVRDGIIVLTKTDLADSEIVEVVREEVRELAQGSFLEGCKILTASSKTGDGIAGIKEALYQSASTLAVRPNHQLFRLPIDRAFSIRGFGTVVTGTLTSGEIFKDQEIELIPGPFPSRIRGIQVHNASTSRAQAGQRTAVNIQGIDLGQVRRGMVLTAPRIFRPSQLLDVELRLLPTASRPLKNFIKVRFHQGTSEVLARVALMDRANLRPGESSAAQLRLDTGIFTLHGDAFIIRQFSPAVTIGGGTVLNPRPRKHRTTDRGATATLDSLTRGSVAERIPVFLAAHPGRYLTMRELNGLLGLAEPTLRKECSTAERTGQIAVIAAPDPFMLLSSTKRELQKSSVALVKGFHEANPLLRGISREELRRKVFDDLPVEVFKHCLDELVSQKSVALHEDAVALHGRTIELSAANKQIQDLIESAYHRSGYQPPLLSELSSLIDVDPLQIREVSFWMIKEKVLVKIAEDLAYHQKTLSEIKSVLRSNYRPGARFAVGDFKTLFTLTRKHAIPLLEFLDRERFTKRQGNERILI